MTLGVAKVLIKKEPSSMMYPGTIIDIETIGSFNYNYPKYEAEHYASVIPTIFGLLTNRSLVQYCAEGTRDIRNLLRKINSVLPILEEPLLALNCNFEYNVLSNCNCFVPPNFVDVRGQLLQASKWSIRERYGFPKYDDPFEGDGSLCIFEWQKGNYEDCLRHNRSCLLIERDIYEYVRQFDLESKELF